MWGVASLVSLLLSARLAYFSCGFVFVLVGVQKHLARERRCWSPSSVLTRASRSPVLETQYQGDTILLIFPDGTGPALLSCLIAGIPLKHVHALNFEPGELRRDVGMADARRLLDDRLPSPSYAAAVARGRDELRLLRREEDELRRLRREEDDELRRLRAGAGAGAPGRRDAAADERGAMERQRHRARNAAAPHTRRTQGAREGRADYLAVGAIGAVGCLSLARGDSRPTPVDADAAGASSVPSPATEDGALTPADAAGATAAMGLPEKNLVGAAETAMASAQAATDGTAAATGGIFRADAVADAPRHPTADDATVPVAAGESALPAPDLVVAAESAIAGALFKSLPSDVPGQSEEELVAAANAAMEEYLSRDDGGEDWLSAMKDIMQE